MRIAAVAVLLVAGAAPARGQAALEFARQLYNQGRYEQAITAAVRLRPTPAVDVANLILGRAYLEQFRRTSDRASLVAAREALCLVRIAPLGSRDRIDYLVGLGEALFLDDSYAAAAELFDSAMARSDELGPRAHERVFDWWATALDRHAQSGFAEDRDGLYAALRDRARERLARVPGSAAAAYWLVVAHRSLGELGRAWDTAVSGWVRAPLADDRGVALRADLDQLVRQAIIPERARQVAATDRDRERAALSFLAAWDAVKQDWAQK